MLFTPLHQFLFALCLALTVANVISASDITGTVSLNNGAPLSNTVVTLNNGEYRTTTLIDGTFEFHAVSPGIYVCDVQSSSHHFPQLKIKIDKDSNNISVVEYKYFGAKRAPATYPLSFVALTPIQYEMKKPPFSIMGFIMANPMMLLMLFSFVMVFAMPKMMQGMSPEELQELQKQSAANGDPMKNLSKLMGMPTANNDDDD